MKNMDIEINKKIGLNILYLIIDIFISGMFIFGLYRMDLWMGDFTYYFFVIIVLNIYYIIPSIFFAILNKGNVNKQQLLISIIFGIILVMKNISFDISFWYLIIVVNNGYWLDIFPLVLWTLGSILLAIILLLYFKISGEKVTINFNKKVEELV
ncbi:MAG: hypothetical protein ACFFDW_12450 [Candidatus Thorarchaeota archaeon]